MILKSNTLESLITWGGCSFFDILVKTLLILLSLNSFYYFCMYFWIFIFTFTILKSKHTSWRFLKGFFSTRFFVHHHYPWVFWISGKVYGLVLVFPWTGYLTVGLPRTMTVLPGIGNQGSKTETSPSKYSLWLGSTSMGSSRSPERAWQNPLYPHETPEDVGTTNHRGFTCWWNNWTKTTGSTRPVPTVNRGVGGWFTPSRGTPGTPTLLPHVSGALNHHVSLLSLHVGPGTTSYLQL